MAGVIRLKRSIVPGSIPNAANLEVGEPAVNLVDQTLFTKDATGNVKVIGSGKLQNLSDVSIASPADNQVLVYDSTLDKWKPGNVTIQGAISAGFSVDKFTGDGSITNFTLSRNPFNINSLLVTIQGVKQRPITDYTLSGNVLSFIQAPYDTDIIDVVHLGSGVSGVSSVNGLEGNAVLTTANINENTNLYFTNARAQAAITGASGISYNQANGVISLDTTTVAASTYGGTTKIPVITVDAFGRITTAANVSVAGVSNFTATGNTFTISTGDGSSFSASIQPNSVRLGTDTTGDYVKNVIPSTGITVSGAPGESRDATIALADTSVTPSTYGGADKVSVFAVDQQGRLTSASNVTIAIPASALTTDVALGSGTSGDYVANLIAGSGIGITNGTGESSQPTITNLGVTSIQGTANQIVASAANASVTLSLPSSLTAPGDLTVTGNLVVNGTTTTINTVQLSVNDPLVRFGDENPADSLDIGFFGAYTSSGIKFAGLFRDASDSGTFKLFKDLTVDPTTNVIDTASYTIATLVTNITGGTVSGLTANIAVGDGGTGRGMLTNNAVLFGQGTSAVGLASGSAYQVLQLNSSGVPVFAGLDGGSY